MTTRSDQPAGEPPAASVATNGDLRNDVEPGIPPASAGIDPAAPVAPAPAPADVQPDSVIADALSGLQAPTAEAPTQTGTSTAVLMAESQSMFAPSGITFADEIVIPAGDLPDLAEIGAKRRRAQIKRLGWGFWVAVAFCLIVILAAIFANLLPIPDPNSASCLNDGLQPGNGPAAGHLLGCDETGRDILSRVIYGARVSLVVGFASIFMAEIVGGILAIIAGFRRGALDWAGSILANVILAFPYLVLGLAITTFWGHSEFDVTVIIAIVATAPLFRVVRAVTIQFAERDYVLAAVALGSTKWRILMKQILPDVIPTAITYGFVGVAIAIVGEGALSFLGQSVPVPTATWGNMIAEGSTQIPNVGSATVNIWELMAPAIAMFLFITAINFIGDRLRSILDVREGVL